MTGLEDFMLREDAQIGAAGDQDTPHELQIFHAGLQFVVADLEMCYGVQEIRWENNAEVSVGRCIN